MDKVYTTVKKLVGQEFRVDKVWGYKWKKWDNGESRYVTSDSWKEGFAKKWQLETDKGEADFSDYQVRMMIPDEVIMEALQGLQYTVKSNGKEGMEIRYFINPVFNKKPQPVEEEPDIIVQDITDEPVDLTGIPFN